MDYQLLSVLSGIFFLSGLVKGFVGFGLPTISLSLLCLVFDLDYAMALLLFPSFFTNIWQALSGGNTTNLLKRFWPLYLCAFISIWTGASLLEKFNPYPVELLLGILLLIYASQGLLGFKFKISKTKETTVGIIAGLFNGVFAGLTGAFVFPGVTYLQSIELKPNVLVQAMGLLFIISTFGLGGALFWNGRLTTDLSLLSLTGVPASVLGLLIGIRFRNLLTETQFRNSFYMCILVLGISVLFQSWEA